MRSPVPAKITVCSPTTSPPRSVAKPIAPGLRSPVTPCARVDRAFGERAAGARRSGLAQRKRGAGRRVDLVLVVHLQDFDVEVGAEALRRQLDQLQQHDDADAHVRRVDDGNARGQRGELRLLRRGQPGGADDRGGAVPRAGRDVRQRAFRPREVDQHVGGAHRGVDVAADDRRRWRTRSARRHRGRCRGLPATSSAAASARSGAVSVASISACPIRPPAPAIAMRVGVTSGNRSQNQEKMPLSSADGSGRSVLAAHRAVDGGHRQRHFVALPARELAVDEIDGEIALLQRLALPLEFVDVVPAIGAERAHDQRRAEDRADLLRRLPDLELVDLVLRQEIALVDVELVDAELLDRRHVGAQRRAAAEQRALPREHAGARGEARGTAEAGSRGTPARMEVGTIL